MPTKTERILSYLPSTFDASARTSAAYNVVDAFGGELLEAENSLAALMAAHWVDHADRTAELIDDLACIARLYGLAPRGAPQKPACGPVSSEESVEEFREHLKRYVRTFLEGTVTVQGILRVVAEVLNLRIADDYADLDTWWTRATDAITTVEPRGDDAARALLGGDALRAEGEAARPARITGQRDLSGGVNLAGASRLSVKVDDDAPVLIDLEALTGKTEGVTLDEITSAINDAPGSCVASHDRMRLTLASPTIGRASRLEVEDTEQDAATLLLGLAPYIYHGEGSTKASVTGLVDLGDGADLSEERYLRLLLDGRLIAEIDCAGANPQHTSLDEITRAINDALNSRVASHDGHFLRLTSTTPGASGSIAFQSAAGQDARERLFGPVPLITSGNNARPAEVVGTNDLSRGVDLSERARMRIRLDGQAAVIINCVGEDPTRTRLDEIVAALATRLGAGLVSHDGRFLHLVSPTAGPDSSIAFELLPAEQDATDIIFGFPRRSVTGNVAGRATLAGRVDLSDDFKASALNHVRVALDGGSAVEVNILRGSKNSLAVTLDEIVDAFNRYLGAGVASHDGQNLILSSPTTGSASSIAIEPLLAERRSRFVTRASILGEAAEAVFGFVKKQERGSSSTVASVTGEPDLSRGIDLREASFLRLALDERPAIDINCAGERPRATTLQEIIDAINKAIPLGPEIEAVASASLDGRRLSLTSPTTGAQSRIAFETPLATDALDLLLGLEPQTAFGSDATRVRFTGTKDLRAGLDLSTADRIKLVIDGHPPAEISCANHQDPARTSINDIVIAINVQLGDTIAFNDGTRIMLVSQAKGAESRIEFLRPDGPDATRAIFGIKPPRSYHGSPAAPARLAGLRDLQGGRDLRFVRSLTVAVEGGPPVTIDCASNAADPAHVTLNEIVAAINAKLGAVIASSEGGRLILSTPGVGAVSRIQLLRSEGNDARPKLLGNVPQETRGDDPAPAAIVGTIELLSPLDLSERRVIRLAADDGRPFDVDISGARPSATSPEEIVEKINATTPLTASIDSEGHLRLAAPRRGEGSRLSLLPVRTLDLIEYPPVEAFDPAGEEPPASASSGALPAPRTVRHADLWRVDNGGATEGELEVELFAPHGTAGPQLLNRSTGQRVKFSTVLRPGERVRFWRAASSGDLRAVVESDEGKPRLVPREQILSGPAGSQAHVPFTGTRNLTDGYGVNQATLQLNDWGAATLDVLRARQFGEKGNSISVTVEQAYLAPGEAGGVVAAQGSAATLSGRVLGDKTGFRLTNPDGATLAHLRAGPNVELDEHHGRVVAVRGALHTTEGSEPLMIVERVEHLFDVTLDYALFRAGDFKDTGALVIKLRDGQDPLSRYLRTQLSSETLQLMKALKDSDPLPESLLKALIDDLDRVIQGSTLFDKERFAQVELTASTLRLIARKPQGEELVRLNVLLLTEAYPNEIEKRSESYKSVRLGAGDVNQEGLEWQINSGPHASSLVRVFGAGKSDVLRLPRGRSSWTYFDCSGSRFDAATFESAREDEAKPGATRFAGGRCVDRAVFNFSRFTRQPLGDEAAIFASAAGSQDPPVELRFRWQMYQPGSFVVNLPHDLPESFGGRFNFSRFGMPNDAEEFFEGVFTEPLPAPPPDDNPNHLVTRILDGPKKVKGEPSAGGSGLLTAELAERVPLGFDLATIPFRKPRSLTGGTDDEAASIYLAEKDVPGFIKLTAKSKGAKSKGAWGNFISVAVRKSGPARFDVTVSYAGARFEHARLAALGGAELPLSVEEVMRPGPVGVLQGKAAGVKAQVTRERARDTERNFNQQQ